MPSIALVRSGYRPDGGAERFMQSLVQALAQQATLQPTLLTRQWPQTSTVGTVGTVGTVNMSGKPTIVELGISPPLWQSRRKKSLAFDHAVSQYLATHPFDLVQMHERIPGGDIYRAGDGLHGAWLAERSRVDSRLRRYWTARDPFHRQQLAQERATLTHPGLKSIVCISRMVQQDIHHHYPELLAKTKIIYNGVDIQHFKPLSQPERQQNRALAGLSPHNLTILFCGSGWFRKGLTIVLQSIAACPTNHPIQLIVVGHDKQRKRYENLARTLGIREQVLFAGVQANPVAYHQLADVFFLPSLYEPFSCAALEALACGCPILVSSRCGAAELVQEGENGFVRDSQDISGFAEVLSLLAGDAVKQRSLRDNARQTALSYPEEQTARHYCALYTKLLTTAPTSPVPEPLAALAPGPARNEDD